MLTPKEVAFWLTDLGSDPATDIEFVEMFTWFYKIQFEISTEELTIADVKSLNIEKLMNLISQILHETIESEEIASSAWWKQEEKTNE